MFARCVYIQVGMNKKNIHYIGERVIKPLKRSSKEDKHIQNQNSFQKHSNTLF